MRRGKMIGNGFGTGSVIRMGTVMGKGSGKGKGDENGNVDW